MLYREELEEQKIVVSSDNLNQVGRPRLNSHAPKPSNFGVMLIEDMDNDSSQLYVADY